MFNTHELERIRKHIGLGEYVKGPFGQDWSEKQEPLVARVYELERNLALLLEHLKLQIVEVPHFQVQEVKSVEP